MARVRSARHMLVPRPICGSLGSPPAPPTSRKGHWAVKSAGRMALARFFAENLLSETVAERSRHSSAGPACLAPFRSRVIKGIPCQTISKSSAMAPSRPSA